MAKQLRGRPILSIRLDQETLDLLTTRAREKFGDDVRGSSGGCSRLVRAWIYEKLERTPPAEYGDAGRNRRIASSQDPPFTPRQVKVLDTITAASWTSPKDLIKLFGRNGLSRIVNELCRRRLVGWTGSAVYCRLFGPVQAEEIADGGFCLVGNVEMGQPVKLTSAQAEVMRNLVNRGYKDHPCGRAFRELAKKGAVILVQWTHQEASAYPTADGRASVAHLVDDVPLEAYPK